MNILAIVGLVYQFADFLVKGIVSYVDTPEGQKEWGDVVGAAVSVGLIKPQDVTDNGESAHSDFMQRLDEIERDSGTSVTGNAATSPKVTVMPPKHGGGD